MLPRGPGLPSDVAVWRSCSNTLFFSFLLDRTGAARGIEVGLRGCLPGCRLPLSPHYSREVRSRLLFHSTCLKDQITVPMGQMRKLRQGVLS